MSAPFSPREIFAALERHGVDYVTIGGFALIAHGVVRATIDVDVIPAPDRSNRERLADALNDLGAKPDGEPATRIDADLLGRNANMRFQTDRGQVDVLAAEQYAERFGALRERAVRAGADGVTVTVVARDDLVALKAGSGRDRDLRDIGDLLSLDPADELP